MTPLETVKAAIAETPDPENREATLREAMASTRYPVDGPASDEERDGWQSMARADRILTEAARRAIEAIPKIARLTRDPSQPADHAAFSSLDEALKWLSDRHAVVILDGQPDTPARPAPAETEGRDDG